MALTKQQQQVVDATLDPSTHLITVQACAGSGKAQPLTEPILTPAGWSTMGSLEKGSYVIGSNGKPSKVSAIHPQGIRDIYKVSFIDGTSVLCDKEHLWTVRDSSTPTYNGYKTITVAEMLTKDICKETLDKRYNTLQHRYTFSIQPSAPCEFTTNEELPISPLAMGLLLGDGALTGSSITFCNASLDLCKTLQKELEPEYTVSSWRFAKGSWNGCIKRGTAIKPFKTVLASLDLCSLSINKHVPSAYLNANLSSRIQLFKGLTDTDGYVKDDRVLEFSSSSKSLAYSYLELGRSIGKTLSIISRVPKYRYKGELKTGHTSYRIRELVQRPKSIVSIEYSHKEEAQCISIEAEDHLYVTSGFNLTHNTHTLVELTKALNPESGLYLAYNRAIAEEATNKFKGTNVQCSTIHSLAYRNVVNRMGLKVGFFTYRDIKERLPYSRKVLLIDTIEQFCLSDVLSPIVYATAQLPASMREIFVKYIDGMANGTITCTHSFYLKMFHALLANGTVTLPTYDILLMDEAGDVTELTLAIFKLMKAKKKIAVGDPMQNIYSFNNTVNAFKLLEGQGVNIMLTESFRVSNTIAPGIETFVQKYYDPSFEFVGHQYTGNEEVITHAYIARTNVGMLDKMMERKEAGLGFVTTRSIPDILELPLILANLNNGKKITNYKYKHIEALRSKYEKTATLQRYRSAQAYIKAELKKDTDVVAAFRVIFSYGAKGINDLLTYAKANIDPNYTFTTSHSSKG